MGFQLRAEFGDRHIDSYLSGRWDRRREPHLRETAVEVEAVAVVRCSLVDPWLAHLVAELGR